MNIVLDNSSIDRTSVSSLAEQVDPPISSYNYALRICIAPELCEDDRIAALVSFCREAAIDELIMHSNCEEIHTGHVSADEMEAWLGIGRRMKAALAPEGVGFSVNPWTTIIHADRGRKLKPGQNFRLMVDTEGLQATSCACPLCTEWQEHICQVYAQWASLHPKVLWIEDDFRLHNHFPLTWGGCFCEEHLRLISEAYGQTISRRELIESITAPGAPHPLRRLWLDLNGRTMVELARRMYEAVKSVSPETRLGLMSSVPATHCSEGRDWPGIIEALGGASDCVIRPHLPAYWENTPGRYLWFFTISRQTTALLPPNISICPELDNGPHTRFSKSCSMTAFQMALAGCLGSEGMTLNVFDMIGNGTSLLEGYHLCLAGVKPFLDHMLSLGLREKCIQGIVVPFSSKSSYTLDTSPEYLCGRPFYDVNEVAGSPMELLYPSEDRWASLLSCYGFSTRVVADQSRFQNEIVAISGQWLRNLSSDEITHLFESNLVILDASAAAVLCSIGLGHLAGIVGLQRVSANTGTVSYEEVSDGTIVRGISRARFSGQVSCGDALLVDYDENAVVVSELKDFLGNTTGPGMVVYDGRCIVLPFFFPDAPQGHMLNSARQELFQIVLSRVATQQTRVSFSVNSPYLAMYRYDMPGSTVLLLANASTDAVESPALRLGGFGTRQYECELCRYDGSVVKHALHFTDDHCTLPESIMPMQMIALSIPCSGN